MQCGNQGCIAEILVPLMFGSEVLSSQLPGTERGASQRIHAEYFATVRCKRQEVVTAYEQVKRLE